MRSSAHLSRYLREAIMSLRSDLLASLIGTCIFLTTAGSASPQDVQMPDIGTFEDYLVKRMPRLVDPARASTTDSVPWLGAGNAGRGTHRVDSLTGLVPPEYPFPRFFEELPKDDPRTLDYERKLVEFLENRRRVLQVRDEYWRAVGERKHFGLVEAQFSYMASMISKWNGDIFSAPASKDSDPITMAGDEVRAVFGPIPRFDVTTIGKVIRPDGWTIETAILATEVEGNIVELKPNRSKSGKPLELEHRDFRGSVVKWTATVGKCDKPSFATGVTICGTGSRTLPRDEGKHRVDRAGEEVDPE